jgi:hypothetical protein
MVMGEIVKTCGSGLSAGHAASFLILLVGSLDDPPLSNLGAGPDEGDEIGER